MKLITYIFISLIVTTVCQQNAWRGIVPLRSTRADVERILGRPAPYSKATDAADYITENERVFVLYSTGPCAVEPSNGWDVPHETVITMSVEPKIKPKLSDLKLDKSKYKESRDPEVLDFIYYTNEEDGISLETREGLVTAFNYWPTAKERSLICPKP